MDPQIEYLDEETKYGVTKSDAAVPEEEELNTSVPAGTKTKSRGLFGLSGGASDTSSSSDSDSEQGKHRQRRRREEKAARKSSAKPAEPTDPLSTTKSHPGGTDYSLDSIEGGRPTGGTDYSDAALEGSPHPTGGTDYSGASTEGGRPTGGTDFSGADLVSQEASTDQAQPHAAPEKRNHLFGL